MHDIARKKHTGEPGNAGQFGTTRRQGSGIQLSPEQDLHYDVEAAAEQGVDPYQMLLARGVGPSTARAIADAARTAAAYRADDGVDRAIDLDPSAPEAIVDIEEHLAVECGDRYGEAPQVGYDYEAWADALGQAWEDRTRELIVADRSQRQAHPAA